MRSTMMDVPLLVPSLLRHASLYHRDAEIVSHTVEGPIHRLCYAELWKRSQRLANLLVSLGLEPGDRVGTLAWNGFRHLELYYGTAAAGLVCHTINPRLFLEQISFIVNHAEDRVLFVDLSFLGLLDSIRDSLTTVETIVIMTDADHMPEAKPLSGLLCYEDLLAVQSDRFDQPALDEHLAAGLCYTSGTTGAPKGVLYSHRSTVLHAMAASLPDSFALNACSVVMPAVPMFHVNAWGLPHAAPLVGAKLVLPGPNLDGRSLYELISSEGVTFSAGVPTVWATLLDWVDAHGRRFDTLRCVAVGGASCPQAIFDRFRDHGVEVLHAWGMTETSPVGLVNRPKGPAPGADTAEPNKTLKQGRPLFGVEVRVLGAEGEEVTPDGRTTGNLQVRGPWVARGYFRLEDGAAHVSADWFDTGDVVTIDQDGFVQIVDRNKDLIKSGGEWIGSVELENIAMSHPAVFEAVVVARPDARWGERPLLVVVRRSGSDLSEQELIEHYSGKVARWTVPDKVVFVDELPHTATVKVLKSKVRDLYCK